MTRSEFKKIVLAYALIPSSVSGETFEPVSGGQTLAEWCIEFGKGGKYAEVYTAIAEVIANGLEPEPESPTLADPYGIMVLSAADVRRAVEHLVGVAKKQGSRTPPPRSTAAPFIGSHNLPHDTDWD